ncbi:MAG: hypothetical protein AABY22_18230 [Nanoarchaeota archaeon]
MKKVNDWIKGWDAEVFCSCGNKIIIHHLQRDQKIFLLQEELIQNRINQALSIQSQKRVERMKGLKKDRMDIRGRPDEESLWSFRSGFNQAIDKIIDEEKNEKS